MKIDFEVNAPELGNDLHLQTEFIEGGIFSSRIETEGQDAFATAQAEIANYDIFPEYDDETELGGNEEGTIVRTVVGRVNGQVYAAIAVFHEGGVDVGHPLLIKHL